MERIIINLLSVLVMAGLTPLLLLVALWDFVFVDIPRVYKNTLERFENG